MSMNTSLKIEQLDSMKPGDERIFWTVLEKTLANDDGAAGKSHLDAGRPIYYCDDRYPDAMVRKWPDGRRELVAVTDDGVATLISVL